MGHTIAHSLREFVGDYGYWAVALALLCENAGLPVPGETTLLLASFLAFSQHKLHLGWIIVVATCAATLGDNIGYLLGQYGGRPLLDRYQGLFRIPPRSVKNAEGMFERYGPAAIFFARFIFGMRVFAGPLAGVLRMRWRPFAVFNFLGAVVWVSCVATAGYLFGRHWRALFQAVRSFNIAVLIIAAVVAYILWRRYRQSRPPEPS
jgi:membrane protein DedA with SNARE-associated domain